MQSRIESLIISLRKYSNKDPWIHDFARFCGLVDPLASEHLELYLKALTRIKAHVVAEQKQPNTTTKQSAQLSLNAFIVSKKADELVRSLLQGLVHINADEAAAAIQQCTLPKLNTSAGVRSVVPLDRFMGIFLQSWLAERAASKKRLMKLFHAFDADKGGTLDMEEFQALLVAANVFAGVENGEQRNREMFQMYCEAVNISGSDDGIDEGAFLVVAERELKHCINRNMEALHEASRPGEEQGQRSEGASTAGDAAAAGESVRRVSIEQAETRLREVLTRVARDKGFEPCELLAEDL